MSSPDGSSSLAVREVPGSYITVYMVIWSTKCELLSRKCLALYLNPDLDNPCISPKYNGLVYTLWQAEGPSSRDHNVLERVESINVLSVTFISNLSWSKHIKSISAKANYFLGMIRRSISFAAPSPVKFQLFYYQPTLHVEISVYLCFLSFIVF